MSDLVERLKEHFGAVLEEWHDTETEALYADTLARIIELEVALKKAAEAFDRIPTIKGWGSADEACAAYAENARAALAGQGDGE